MKEDTVKSQDQDQVIIRGCVRQSVSNAIAFRPIRSNLRRVYSLVDLEKIFEHVTFYILCCFLANISLHTKFHPNRMETTEVENLR